MDAVQRLGGGQEGMPDTYSDVSDTRQESALSAARLRTMLCCFDPPRTHMPRIIRLHTATFYNLQQGAQGALRLIQPCRQHFAKPVGAASKHKAGYSSSIGL